MYQPGSVVHTCNPSAAEAEARKLPQVQGHQVLHLVLEKQQNES